MNEIDVVLRLALAIVVTLALVVLNGVLVAAEFAIVRVRRTRLEELAGEGTEAAHLAAATAAFLLITTMHVVVGELVPKTLAVRRAEHLLLALARPLQILHAFLRRHMHTRLPLCRGGLDSVVGVVGMKDAWPLLLSEKSNAAFERAARPPIKIPVDLLRDGILRRLQEGRGQMGIVRDADDQKTLGIVTLEDVLESLAGNVREAPRGERAP